MRAARVRPLAPPVLAEKTGISVKGKWPTRSRWAAGSGPRLANSILRVPPSMESAIRATETPARRAVKLGGCRITCPLADHPHPTQRKRVARADHRDSYRWVSVRGVRGRCTEERRGTSEGSARARARANALTFCCPLCTHLVDINAASKSARKQGRRTLKAGDGCLRCGPHYRPSKFASAQRSKVEGLMQGKRVLIARPEHIGEDAPMTMLSGAEAAHRITRAQLEFPPPFHAREQRQPNR